MSKPSRYWMYNIAIGAGAVATIVGLISVGSLLERSYEVWQLSQQLRYAQNRELSHDQPPLHPASPNDDPSLVLALSKADLAAQESMARSASALLAATWTQTLIAAIGTVGLIVSLTLTRSALQISRLSREDAIIHAQRELRAYVSLADLRFDMPSLSSITYTPATPLPGTFATDFVVLTIKNHGHTPASKVRVWVLAVATPIGSRLPDNHKFQEFDIDSSTQVNIVTKRTLHPNQEFESRVPIWDATEFIRADRGLCSLVVYGQVLYSDIYDISRKTNFCFLYEPMHPVGKRFTAHALYNEAN